MIRDQLAPAPSPQDAMSEGASALRYRIERLRAIASEDDALVSEMLDRWMMAARILEGMAGERVRL